MSDNNTGCAIVAGIILIILAIGGSIDGASMVLDRVGTNWGYFILSLLILGLFSTFFLFAKASEKNGIINMVLSILYYIIIIAFIVAGFFKTQSTFLIAIIGVGITVLCFLRIAVILLKDGQEKSDRIKNNKIRQELLKQKRILQEEVLKEVKPIIYEMNGLCHEYNNCYINILNKDRMKYVEFFTKEYIKLKDKFLDTEEKIKKYYQILNLKDFDSDIFDALLNVENRIKDFYKECDEINSIYNGYNIGLRGEMIIEKSLNAFGVNRYTYIKNLVLKNVFCSNDSVEIDIVVITRKGIFVIEIKNRGEGWKNDKLKISKDGRWEIYDRNNELKYIWDSVTEQNIRHKIAIEEKLKELLKTNRIGIEIIPIIVFANNDITIHNESNNVVLRASELINYIEMFSRQEEISEDYVKQIACLLENSNEFETKEVKVPNYEKRLNEWVKLYEIELKCLNVYEKNAYKCEKINLQMNGI